MKLSTIRNYVRYSNKPYSEIITKAVRSGWKILKNNEYTNLQGEAIVNVEIKNPGANEWFETHYYKDNPDLAMCNLYTP